MKVLAFIALTSAVSLNKHKWVPGVTFVQDAPISDSKDDRYFEESYQSDVAKPEYKEITEVKLTKE
jgi:hypothetical protein